MRDEMTAVAMTLQAANDGEVGETLPGDPDGASIDDTPMSDPDDAALTDEDIDLFEDDPTIPTE
ncbi:hypothetical protein KXR94_11355 [Stutzerimonas stutzeri]